MGPGEVSESDPHRMEAVWLNCTAPPALDADGCDAVCMDGSRPLMYVRRGVGDGAHKWHIHHQVGTAMADRWRHPVLTEIYLCRTCCCQEIFVHGAADPQSLSTHHCLPCSQDLTRGAC
jgi:hypothetical protein